MQTRRFPHLVRKCRPRVHVLGEGSHQQIKLVIHLLHPLLNLRVLLIDSTQSLLSSPVHLRTYIYRPTSTHLLLHTYIYTCANGRKNYFLHQAPTFSNLTCSNRFSSMTSLSQTRLDPVVASCLSPSAPSSCESMRS